MAVGSGDETQLSAREDATLLCSGRREVRLSCLLSWLLPRCVACALSSLVALAARGRAWLGCEHEAATVGGGGQIGISPRLRQTQTGQRTALDGSVETPGEALRGR